MLTLTRLLHRRHARPYRARHCSCPCPCPCPCSCSWCHPEHSEGPQQRSSLPRRFQLFNQPVGPPRLRRVPHLRVVPFDAKVGISTLRLRVSTLVCTLCLLGSAAAAQPLQTQTELRQTQALWLSQQLHRTIEAAQILVSPESTTLEGCTITRSRLAPTGATALSLRCPASRLPHLVLLNVTDTGGPHLPGARGRSAAGGPHPPAVGECGMQHTPGGPHAVGECGMQRAALASSSAPAAAPRAAPSSNIVRAGAALTADWRTAFIHAQLPVVALESGAAGAEIRVRVPQTNRIVRARILSADAVAIVMAGA